MSIFSKNEEPQAFDINDKPLVCHNCKNQTFFARQALLNTSVAEFFGVGWANRSAQCVVCSQCSYIHWFLGKE